MRSLFDPNQNAPLFALILIEAIGLACLAADSYYIAVPLRRWMRFSVLTAIHIIVSGAVLAHVLWRDTDGWTAMRFGNAAALSTWMILLLALSAGTVIGYFATYTFFKNGPWPVELGVLHLMYAASVAYGVCVVVDRMLTFGTQGEVLANHAEAYTWLVMYGVFAPLLLLLVFGLAEASIWVEGVVKRRRAS